MSIPRCLLRLLLGLLLLLLTGVVMAYAMGLRVSGLGWQQGLTVQQWRWQPQGCVLAQGERLRLQGGWPLLAQQQRLAIMDCGDGHNSKEPLTLPEGLPWTPPFALAVEQLSLPPLAEQALPILNLTLTQHQQQWQLQARSNGSELSAGYGRDGAWRVDGAGAIQEWLPQWQGRWRLSGAGSWLADPQGALSLALTQVGLASRTEQADLNLDGEFLGLRWKLSAALSQPLALSKDWRLEAGPPSELHGDGLALIGLQAALRLVGEAGVVVLLAQSGNKAGNASGSTLEQGQGSLTLSGAELSGEVNFAWQDRLLILQPAQLGLPQALSVGWQQPLVIPMAEQGSARLPVTLGYQQLTLRSDDSELLWQGDDWKWKGALALDGYWQGYRVDGQWQGAATPQGLSGEPISISARQGQDRLHFRLPLDSLHRAPYSGRASVDGSLVGYPLSATLDFAKSPAGWQGTAKGRSRLVDFDRGGEVDFQVPWLWDGQTLLLARGSKASIAEGLLGQVLLRPVTVAASQRLRISDRGVSGKLSVNSGGLLAARWRLPPFQGEVALQGHSGQARLTVAEWQSELTGQGQWNAGGVSGDFRFHSPLLPAMGLGLDMTPQQGQLQGAGQWRWNEGLSANGSLTVADAQLAWGSVVAEQVQAELDARYRDGQLRLVSRGPVTVASLDVGTPIRNLTLKLDSDLSFWQFSDIRADLLGGYLLAPALDWPSPRPQPVVLSRIDLAEVAALQNPPPVSLSGRVGGYIPLQLGVDYMAVKGGRLANEEPLSLMIPPSSSVQAMGQSNQAVKLALDSLSTLLINDFQARLDMAGDGWLDAAVTIKGINPQRKNLPVVFNYTHKENVFTLMRSLRIGDEITEKIRTERP